MMTVSTEVLYTSISLLLGAINTLSCWILCIFWCFIHFKYCAKLGAKSFKAFNLYKKANVAVQRLFPIK